MSIKRFVFFFFLVLAITVVDFFYLDRPSIGIDDANIFFTYAHNLANGHGFVFNVNGERVEGFTSLLWVLICAASYLITPNPEWLLMFLLVLMVSATITLVYEEVLKDVKHLSHALYRNYFFWLYCAFIVCIGPSFIAWSVLSLMENGLWNFLFVVITIMVLRAYRKAIFSRTDQLLLVVSTSCLILTRPEGLAWSALFFVLIAFLRWRNRQGWKFTALYGSLIALTIWGLIRFRMQYFGYPLPNTYYAKVSHDLLYNIKTGAEYAIHFVTAFHPIVCLLLAILVCVALSCPPAVMSLLRRRPSSATDEHFVLHRLIIVTGIIVICILLPLITGGDHFGGFRFYQNIIPLFAWGLPAAHWIYQQAMIRKVTHQIRVLGATLFVFFLLIAAGSLYAVKGSYKTQLNYEFFLAKDGRRVATEFAQLWNGKKPSVGVVATGGFALAYTGETVDLMGLNNTMMGHSTGDRTGIKNHAAFNKDVFYRMRPEMLLPRTLAREKDAILIYADFLHEFNFENLAMKHIFNDTIFQQQYVPVMLRKRSGSQPFFAFARNDYFNGLQADSNLVVQRVEF